MSTENAPKVTIHQPSEQIMAATNTVETVAVGGMTISLKRPGVLAHYRIVEIVGDTAKNEVYMNMVMPILWVVEINGEPEPAPTTKRELEALIQRLGEDGVNAIVQHIHGRGVDKQSDEAVKN